MVQDHAVVGQEAGRRRDFLRPAIWCPHTRLREERGGGGGNLNKTCRIPFLPEEVEARAFFPLGTGHADTGQQNPTPPDEAVGGPYWSGCH